MIKGQTYPTFFKPKVLLQQLHIYLFQTKKGTMQTSIENKHNRISKIHMQFSSSETSSSVLSLSCLIFAVAMFMYTNYKCQLKIHKCQLYLKYTF